MRRWAWRWRPSGVWSRIPAKAIGEGTQEAEVGPPGAGKRTGSQANLELVLGTHLEMATRQGYSRIAALARRLPLCHPG